MNKQNKNFEAIIGHLIDLYNIATFRFVNAPHSYTKFRAIKASQIATQSKNFIETGTYLGVTTRRCAPFFENVYTIELDKELAKKANTFLKPNKNVQVFQGDTLDILPELLRQEIVKDCLIFLDGHFSGGITACGSLAEPAIEELKIIAMYKNKVNAIIIDDFRLFGTEPGFPSKTNLFQLIEDNFPEFNITVHLDQLILNRLNKKHLTDIKSASASSLSAI
ncbi:MAG: rRNA adenine N-6-methyltransferase family protein [Nostoc sp.]|uniref:rRNA adenine N-6-methyltransferase family protein n=1 Tax=Nostoc sp. TaxID=1180 RepID=UPI002FF137AD